MQGSQLAEESNRFLKKLFETKAIPYRTLEALEMSAVPPALGLVQLPWLSVQKVSGKALCLSSAKGRSGICETLDTARSARRSPNDKSGAPSTMKT